MNRYEYWPNVESDNDIIAYILQHESVANVQYDSIDHDAGATTRGPKHEQGNAE